MPADSAVIENGDSQPIQMQLVNNGPDTFQVSDTMYIFGNLFDQGANVMLKGTPSQAIPPGVDAVIQFSAPFGLLLNERAEASDTTMELCVSLVTGNLLTAPIATEVWDTLPENNTSCVIVTFKGSTATGIAAGSNVSPLLALYPNPADDLVSFDITLKAKEHVQATVRDMTGRTVALQDYGNKSAGRTSLNMNVSGLRPGIYLVQVRIGEEIQSGKLLIR